MLAASAAETATTVWGTIFTLGSNDRTNAELSPSRAGIWAEPPRLRPNQLISCADGVQGQVLHESRAE